MRVFLALLLMAAVSFTPLPLPAGDLPETTPPLSAGPQNSLQQQDSNTITYKTGDIRDIHGPHTAEDRSFLPLLLTGATLLVLAGLFFLWKSRRKIPVPSIPAGQTALAELNSIRTLMTSDLALVYMEKVTGILRRYVEARFSIPCTRKTSREFLQSLQTSDMAAGVGLRPFLPELKTCLEICDRAKFSHRLPEPEEITQVEVVIRDFIEKTGENLDAAGEQ